MSKNKISQKTKVLAVGMAEKAKEFTEKGSEICQGELEGVDEHH